GVGTDVRRLGREWCAGVWPQPARDLRKRPLKRPPEQGVESEQQAQEQDVTHDPTDVAELVADHEQREESADEGGERDAPLSDERREPAHPVDARASAIRRATSSRRSAATPSRRSPGSA